MYNRKPQNLFRLMASWFMLIALAKTSATVRADGLPSASTGGKNGGPLSVLFIIQSDNLEPVLDGEVAKRLKAEGYLVQVVSDREALTADYLDQFNTVVAVGLDDYFGGAYYEPSGLSLLNTAANVQLLHDYVDHGGGLVLTPVMNQAGSQAAAVLDKALAPWKIRIGWENVRDDANPVDDPQNPGKEISYAWTHNVVPGPLTAGVKALVYPTVVMRWDDAYSCNPLMPGDPAWQVLARGEATSQGVRFVGNNRWIPGEAGTAPILAAARQAGKGRVVVLGIGGYYLFTHAFVTSGSAVGRSTLIGENSTGPLEGIAYANGDGKTPSDWGVLLDNVLRWTGQAGTEAGFGGTPAAWENKEILELPNDPVPPFVVVDWKTQQPPVTWAHHSPDVHFWRAQAFYDEIPDPLVTKPQVMNKILIGARSANSDGKGTVEQWAAAAKAAGFTALVFTERFEDFKPDNWPRFVQECQDASTPSFACLQGLDIPDFSGNRFLLMGNVNFPAKDFLTPDGKALQQTARLSLGFSQHIAGIARPGADKGLPTELYRHFQAIPVYTYGENQGKYGIVDDGFASYRWQLDNASNPVPIIVHELTSPKDVAKKGTMGFQLIVPSQNAEDAVRYFRYGMNHFFENPPRYFVTDGPIITDWSIFNKDIGAAEFNRDHFRCDIGAASPDDALIQDAVLYDRSHVVADWTPGKTSFSTQIDGEHGYQRYYMLVVTDSKGRRAISPTMRTVARGYISRCGDRQNWFGAAGSYTGIWPSGRHGVRYVDPLFPVGAQSEGFDGGTASLATELSFPFASNAVTFTDMKIDSRYLKPLIYGMDAWPIYNVEPSRTYELQARVGKWHDVGTGFDGYGGGLQELTTVDTTLRSRMAAQPTTPLFPVIQRVPPDSVYVFTVNGQSTEGKLDGKAGTLIDLPAGATIDNLLLLEPLTASGDGNLGWRATAGQTIPVGTQWHTAYQYMPATWRASLGAEGATPWQLDLTQGKLTKILGLVNLAADDSGVAGQLHAGGPLAYLPLAISGLHDQWPAALWVPEPTAYSMGGLYHPVAMAGTASDTFLADFGVFEGIGYAALPAQKDTQFFAGNTLTATDPRLFLAYALWTSDSAVIEVQNPTGQLIKAHLSSPASIPGRFHVDTDVTVPAGQSVRVTLQKS